MHVFMILLVHIRNAIVNNTSLKDFELLRLSVPISAKA